MSHYCKEYEQDSNHNSDIMCTRWHRQDSNDNSDTNK